MLSNNSYLKKIFCIFADEAELLIFAELDINFPLRQKRKNWFLRGHILKYLELYKCEEEEKCEKCNGNKIAKKTKMTKKTMQSKHFFAIFIPSLSHVNL